MSDYKGKYVLLLFYPEACKLILLEFHFLVSHLCPTELLAYNQRLDEFKQLDTIVLSISVDNKASLRAWMASPKSQGFK